MQQGQKQGGRKMSAFEIYLRTGKRPQLSGIEEGVEVKFNPWHDPDDGRFTFKGQGTHYGHGAGQRRHRTWSGGGFTGGGGGRGGGAGATGLGWPNSPKAKLPQPKPAMQAKPRDVAKSWGKGGFQGSGGGNFGGGGATATGTWGPKSASPAPKSRQGGTPTVSKRQIIQPPAKPQVAKPVQQNQEQFRVVEKNGYRFQIDSTNRTRRVSGRLSAEVASRSKLNQRQAGGSDRRPTDDGGHYVAARFNGPSDAFNHFAQDANFNRGRYRAIENEWASALRAGERVQVNIIPHYESGSQRPYEIDVSWTVNGGKRSQKIPNERSK